MSVYIRIVTQEMIVSVLYGNKCSGDTSVCLDRNTGSGYDREHNATTASV